MLEVSDAAVDSHAVTLEVPSHSRNPSPKDSSEKKSNVSERLSNVGGSRQFPSILKKDNKFDLSHTPSKGLVWSKYNSSPSDLLPVSLTYKGERDINFRRHGYGSMLYSNGDIYVGSWRAGERNGRGSYSYTDGSHYVGEWALGLRMGRGIMKYPDGSRYEGNWYEDERHGWGKFEFNNGDIYEGQFFHGRIQCHKGLYSFVTPPHLCYLGPFKKNVITWMDCAMVGPGKLYKTGSGSSAVAERMAYADSHHPYSAQEALEDLCLPRNDSELEINDEIVTGWSDISSEADYS